jgi:hypothetical protein
VLLGGSLTQETSTFQYAGGVPRQGSELAIQTPNYRVSGTITHLDRRGETLERSETTVQLSTTVPANLAGAISTGDTVTVADRQVATLKSVVIGPAVDPARRQVTLTATIQMYTGNGQPQYARRSISPGSTIPLSTSEYDLSGEVIHHGTMGIDTSTTNVVLESTVPTTAAGAISVGDTYTVQNRTAATIDAVQVYPTENPAEKRLIVGTALQTITRDEIARFAGEPVMLGSTIPFRTSTYNFTGNVVGVGGQTPPGSVTETTVRLKIDNISPEIADGIQVGMTEQRDGTTYARITDIRSENATVVLTSENGNIYRREHPVNQDVYLTATLQTRRTDTGLMFHARSLQEGNRVMLDLGSITVEAIVNQID